jgi:hypothetical protein
MAIPYERIVAEDLNRGYGPTPVTMPAGGTAMGSKIGLHTFAPGWLNIQDKGAVPGSDSTVALLEARDALAANGGGRLVIPAGEYLISQSLDINVQNMVVTGDGGNHFGNQITGQAATKLKWVGAPGGTLMRLTAIPGALNPAIRGAGIEHLYLDGNQGRAGRLLEVRSASNCWIDHVTFMGSTSWALYIGTVPFVSGLGAGEGLGELRGNQNCTFTNLMINQYVSDGAGMCWDGDPGWNPPVYTSPLWESNTSQCVFDNLLVFTNSQPCLYVANADSNVLKNGRFYRITGGCAVILDMPYGIGHSFVESNIFYDISCPNGFEQKGGASNNRIWGYSRAQGEPAPTITTGLLEYIESPPSTSLPPFSTWFTFANLYVAKVQAAIPVAGNSGSSGVEAVSHDPAGQGGVDLYDANSILAAQVAVRNASNPLFPGAFSILGNEHDVVIKGQMNAGELATTATAGFLCIPTCNGTPTGVPTVRGGVVPIVFDRAGNKLWVYDGGWIAVSP